VPEEKVSQDIKKEEERFSFSLFLLILIFRVNLHFPKNSNQEEAINAIRFGVHRIKLWI